MACSVDALLGTPKARAGVGAAGVAAGPPGLSGLLLQGPEPTRKYADGAAAAGHVVPAGDDPAAVWRAGGAHPGQLLVAREVLHRVQDGEGSGGPGQDGQVQAGQAAGQGLKRGKGKKDKGPGGGGGWACLPCVEQLRWSEVRAGERPELRVRLLGPKEVPE